MTTPTTQAGRAYIAAIQRAEGFDGSAPEGLARKAIAAIEDEDASGRMFATDRDTLLEFVQWLNDNPEWADLTDPDVAADAITKFLPMTTEPTTQAGRDAAWRELIADALASDGRISDADVKNAVKRHRPHIEAIIEARDASGLREALDAHTYTDGCYYCDCGVSVNWSYADWLDHREQAVRAALAIAPPEPFRITVAGNKGGKTSALIERMTAAFKASGATAVEVTAPPEPRWPSRAQLIESLNELMKQGWRVKMPDGMTDAPPNMVVDLLAALREGAERP